ncbi:hypothetical protein KIPB_002350, partial [Kipferlia bialata]
DLKDILRDNGVFPETVLVQYLRDRDSREYRQDFKKKSAGWAVVVFKSAEEAQQCKEVLDGRNIEGRNVHVHIYEHIAYSTN